MSAVTSENSNAGLPLVSVVVPVYKVERWLDRCVSSIVHQTYKNLEIILVDDGSPDKCPQLCDEWALQDARIKVVHKKNGGLSDARNEGLRKSSGKYICFVDSDDYVDSRMLSILHPYQIRQYDIIQFGMVQEDEYLKTIGYINFPEEEVIGREEVLTHFFSEYRMPSLACRIFKRNLFDKVDIKGRNIGIDEMVILQLMGKADSLISIGDVLYHIYVRNNSVSRSEYSKERIYEITQVHDFLWNYIKNQPNTLKKYILIKNIQAYLGMVACCEQEVWRQEKHRIQEGLNEYMEYAKQYGIWKPVKKQLGKGFTLYRMNHNAYRTIQRIRRI